MYFEFILCSTMACLGAFLTLILYDFAVFGQKTITVNLNNGQGQVLGSRDTTLWTDTPYWQFLSIPYAESPKGDLRFKAPVPRKPWTGVHNGTKFGLRCPVITTVETLSSYEKKYVDLEDCLNLCVYTKSLTRNQPVMFYIYGGGFYNGSASDHPPKHLLAYENMVLVVAQYRIGALGWLTTFTENMPGNAPVADLMLALEWVQTHIAQFGGNPERVTIVGQSAGAIMGGALMLSPETANKELFRGAILQSGSIMSNWAIRQNAYTQSERLCFYLVCDNCLTLEGVEKCLREASVVDILAVTPTDRESFGPVVGDALNILPRPPKVLLEELNCAIPVFTGFTKHDGSFALATIYDNLKKQNFNFSSVTVREFAEMLITTLTKDNVLSKNLFMRLLFDHISDQLDSFDHKKAIPAYFDIVNVALFKSDIINFAQNMALKKFGNVYLYTFDYVGEHTRFGYEFGNDQYPFEGGVHHSNDNIYIFSTHELNETDTRMAKKMVRLWTSFVKYQLPLVSDGDAFINGVSTEKGPYYHLKLNITLGEDILKEITVTIDDKENYRLIRRNHEF